jgi:hypothetical protein
MALLAVLVALAVLEVAALGVLMIATETHAGARDGVDALRVRRGAESAVRAVLAAWDESTLANVATGERVRPAGGTGTLPGNVAWFTEVERLRGSRWLVRGEAAITANGRLRARAAALAAVTAVPLDEVWLDFHAAIGTGDANTPAAPPAPWAPADCPPSPVAPRPPPPIMPAGISLDSATTLTAAGAAITGSPAVLRPGPRTSPADFTRFGPLDRSALLTVADRVVAGTLVFAPAAIGGSCDTSARDNAGAPEDPAHPCHDFFPLIVASGDLDVGGGEGQGILVVAGRLTLAPGVRFYGAILAGEIDAPAFELHGALRTARGGRLGGFFHYSTCAIGRAAQRSGPLRKVFRPSGRVWLAPF